MLLINALAAQMAFVPNQAAVGPNSDVNPATFGQLGAPGTKCALCGVLIKDNGACKGQCKFGKIRKADGGLGWLAIC